MQTVPSREGSEWTSGRGKEGRWRRRSRRATPALEFLRRKDRARRGESLLSGLPRRTTSRVHSLRPLVSPTSTGDRPLFSFLLSPWSSLVPARREYDRYRRLLPWLNSEFSRRQEEEEDEEEEEEVKGKEDAKGRRSRNEQPNQRSQPVSRRGWKGNEEETTEERRETGGGREGGGRAPLAELSARSLARSRVARGLLRGREGPYRCRSRRFRAAKPSRASPSFAELDRAAGQSGARLSQGGRATAECPTSAQGYRRLGQRESKRASEEEGGTERGRGSGEEERQRARLLHRFQACLVSRLCVAPSDQEDGPTGGRLSGPSTRGASTGRPTTTTTTKTKTSSAARETVVCRAARCLSLARDKRAQGSGARIR